MKVITHRLFALLMALLGTLCLTTTHADPAIWKVQGKHNTVYLLGTIHLLHGDQPLPANVQQTYTRAQQLWMEVDMQTVNPVTLQTLMFEKGLLPPGQTLFTQVDDVTREKLQGAASRLGMSVDTLSRFRPWLAALTLEMMQYSKQGYVASSGVDLQLSQLAVEDHKATFGFETLEQQLDLFATLDAAAEQAFLQQTLDELTESDTELAELETAWLAGDDASMTRYLQQGFADDPALFTTLTSRRNQRWVTALRPVLEKQSEDVLVAVGALHLVGEQGLVTLLKKAGYRVTRQ